MSKLERQLNRSSGEGTVAINWPRGELVNVDQLRQQLIREIDCHHHRIPIDLRGVHGAPHALVELLQEIQRYARSEGKLLSVSAALPAMQQALNPRNQVPESVQDEPSNASDVADELLETRYNDEPRYDISKAEKVARPKVKRSKARNRRRNRFVILGLIIASTTAVIGAVEWYFLDQAPLVIQQEDHTFEND